jgi:dipeptidyl aminopeptidase/acylaminoacyl peptidase
MWIVILASCVLAAGAQFATAPLLAQEKAADAKAEPKAADRWTVDEMMKVKSVGNAQLSPDGKRVAHTVTRAVMEGDKSEMLTHVWLAAADGSDNFQLTQGEKSATNPQWSPDGRWLAFTSSRSGKNNLWLIRADGGEAEQLTDVKSSVTGYSWSPDGKWIAFNSPDAPSEQEEKDKKQRNDARVVDEDFKRAHIWLIPIAKDEKGKREARQLTKGDFHVGGGFGGGAPEWSPDGKTIAFAHTTTPLVDHWPTADISVVEVASAKITPLAATKAAEDSPVYSPDGKWIAFSASEIPPTWGFSSVVHVVAAGGGAPKRLAATPDQQADLLDWSADGKAVYVEETKGTVGRIYALPVDGSAPREVSSGEGVFGGVNLSKSRTAVAFVWHSSERASEAHVSSLDRWQPVQVSRANADMPKHPLGRTEVIRWKSKDGMEIEGLLTYPVGYEKGKRYPFLLIIHGGPAGVYTQSFIGNRSPYPMAVYAAEGYAMLRANPRGSSGYGHKFRHANYKDWGGMDYQDLMTGVDHVIAMGVADPERMGVMGWSYGGFMTSWVITQTRRFKAASIGAPVTNLMSFTGTTDIPSFVPDYFGAEFWDNLDAYRQHSAMFNVKNASTPAIILHGERDARVHFAQGMEMYNALKRQGVLVKMIAYPRQPHGLQEPRLVLDAARRNVEWFAQYVKQEKTTSAGASNP